ncbi:hypothetical protein GW916_14950 [bacterium]|nr:hypothetical protein [bacterium]
MKTWILLILIFSFSGAYADSSIDRLQAKRIVKAYLQGMQSQGFKMNDVEDLDRTIEQGLSRTDGLYESFVINDSQDCAISVHLTEEGLISETSSKAWSCVAIPD